MFLGPAVKLLYRCVLQCAASTCWTNHLLPVSPPVVDYPPYVRLVVAG